MIMSFLPTFKVFEMNNLTGLRNGHILANMKADLSKTAVVTYGEHKFLENGIILGLDAAGTVSNYSPASHKQPFVHYTEELLTYSKELKHYAEPVVDGTVYPRCVALYVGDTFTTNNYTGEIEGDGYATVNAGKLVLQAGAENAMFKATVSTLPDGEAAYEFLYLGV
jgi:hypothetical protein